MYENFLLNFAVFGCLGITTEIFFTAASDFVAKIRKKEQPNWSLTGKSYIWMFFIYGSAAIFIPPVYEWSMQFPLIIRLLLYMLGIFTVEFITGWLLEITTGKCPWHYTNKWAIKGYIRLDYAFFWMFFGFMLETIYGFLIRLSFL